MLTIIAANYLSIELYIRKIEEPHLESLRSQIFLDYKETTGRYIPSMEKRL